MDLKFINKVEGGQKYFEQIADSFHLTVTLKDSLLSIQLDDLTNWTKYKSQYTKSHQSIHQKMNLNDIYEYLKAPTPNSQTEEYAKYRRIYKFGDTIIDANGNQCYRIDQGGKITVFRSFYNKGGRKIDEYRSVLQLAQDRKMTQRQIIQQKKKNNISFKLEGKNEKISQYQLMNKQLVQILEVNCRKIDNYSQQDSSVLLNNAVIKSIFQPKNNSFFEVKEGKIRYKKEGEQPSHYIFQDRCIFANVQSEFCLKINKITQNKMRIGIIDYLQLRKSKIDDTHHICISANGQLSPKDKNHHIFLNETNYTTNDVIRIYIKRKTSEIVFYINEHLKAWIKDEMLADGFRIFVPFVEMGSMDDEVQWVDKEKLNKIRIEKEKKKKKDRLENKKSVFQRQFMIYLTFTSYP